MTNDPPNHRLLSRRVFLSDLGMGFTGLALGAMLHRDALGNEAQWSASLAALDSAKGFVRNWLRDHLDLRVTPVLDFRADRSMERAANIQTLLKQLKHE